ncbi:MULTISPECIES: acetate--CoA ligase family protein [unclassified Paracoccus (in: a-proteobacteria)]|uniref:acetate--CoA ligase family protein n=1 Tax=unclassified Paracoccus (in: a-proteobacteria) TaxID=2688777 RepID=UPI001602B3EA|nr:MULTISPECIES: acetate--CoA ligase family protein [unclassified Paracoccus (in: a-proteobacteria)]MBB1492848.1 acetate--CoA ligase family protein [Paracoccus sp. MC1854]MBB1499497.1 acetate--CoA ligase family protein [Paracoccus sp. MC1862]QQO45809.1 acetate--CoA ligase family protein [Paracoccus sp. MC1862]
MSQPDFSGLSSLLAPRSVAIIGASGEPLRIGGRPIAAMLRAGFTGRIMPVNPNRDTIQGLECFPSVADLPDTPEAGIVAVPAKAAIEAVEALGQRGCKAVTLFTSGFAELGEAGREGQRQLVEAARRHGMRLLGPNSLGAYNVGLGYYGTFSSSLDTGFPLNGTVGIASQSGAYGAHLGAVARDRSLGTGVLVATGNEADITVGDVIGWMAGSDQIQVICAYLEGLNNPRTLLSGLDAARAAGKPVFVLKAGRSAVGSHAAASHTASLTGDDKVAEAVLADHGAIRVRDTEEMMDFAYAATQRIYPVENSLGFITVSGGAGIVASDEAEAAGLPMPPMPQEAQDRLRELLPIASAVNPLDCTAQALNDLTLFESFMRAALDDGGYASVACFATYVAGGADLAPQLLRLFAPLRAEYPDRLLVLCAMGPSEVMRSYEDAGFLVFQDPSRAVRAIAAMGRVGRMLATRPAPRPEIGAPVALPPETPDEAQAKALLASAGIAAPPEEVVTSADGTRQAADRIGYPVVMKIVSPDILHKSDIGGVKLNIASADEAAAAYEAILAAAAAHAPDARISGVLVVRQVSGGVECLMGINRDPSFGPVAAFGLGGIFVEILNDVVVQTCPFDQDTARRMILSTRAAPLLTGARGRPPADLDALAGMLSRLSVFAAAAGPRLVSIDLNPVVALPSGAYALDAVIELDQETDAD